MSKIKGLLFDKDGTLFDFAATWEAWAHSFLMRLCDGDMARATAAGQLIDFDMETRKFAPTSLVIAGTAGEVARALHVLFEDVPLENLLQVLNEEAEKAPQQPAVPLMPLLTDLRGRGLRLGVATNDAEAPARAHLGQAGVAEMLDFIAGYDSGFGGKPAPGQLIGFAKHTDLAPNQIAMIGDSTHDLHAGRAAGMTCIAVLTGLASAADLSPYADVVLPDIGHLPGWLDAQTG